MAATPAGSSDWKPSWTDWKSCRSWSKSPKQATCRLVAGGLMPLGSVSRKVSELEAYLKIRLFIRSTRTLKLTDVGQAYVPSAKRILEEVHQAEKAATGEFTAPRGELTVTAPVVFGRIHVLPIVTDFMQSYSEISIRLFLADRLLHLLDDHLDLAVQIGPLADSSVVATRVGTIRLVVCASPAYIARCGIPRSIDELVQHDCVNFSQTGSIAGWTFTIGDKKIKPLVRPRLTVTTAEAAIDAAVEGVGVTQVFFYQAEHAIRSGKLQVILENFEPAVTPVSLAHSGQGLLPLKLRMFLTFATPRIRDRLLGSALPNVGHTEEQCAG